MAGGLYPPLSILATWRPNYINPETRGKGILIAEVIMLASCYLIVGVRIWTRHFLSKSLGVDDLLIILNLIPLTGLAICLCLAYTTYHYDRHIWDVPSSTLLDGRRLTIPLEVTYTVSTVTTKISVLMFYKRLTSRVTTQFIRINHAAILFVLAYGVAALCVLFLICQPFESYWKSLDPLWREVNLGSYKCNDEAASIVAFATISMVQDFMVCLLPLAFFLKLSITRRRKVALAGIFGFGFFLCICGIVRLVAIIQVYYTTYDLTWASWPIWLWTGIESHMAIVCASAPALNYFFQHIFKDRNSSSHLSQYSRHQYDTQYDGMIFDPNNDKLHPGPRDMSKKMSKLGYETTSIALESNMDDDKKKLFGFSSHVTLNTEAGGNWQEDATERT